MKQIFLFITLVTLGGCIKPFDVEVDEGAKMLVVNGMITNEAGPYSVKLNKTTSYGGHFSDIHPDVKKAEVTITDDLGTIEKLNEVRDGEYETRVNGILGRVEGKYTLRIKLKNGQEYISDIETLKPVPAIDKVKFELKETVTIDKNENEFRNPYFEIQADIKDPVNEKNFYRWVSIGTYQVETQPENFVLYDKNGNPVSAPKQCCNKCWITRTDYSATVSSDLRFNGHNLTSQPVTTIPISPQYLGIKYHIELKQFSISEKVYNFWKTVESQSSGTGSVQDPAPANAYGNITNINNPEERILGYFGASAVTRKTLFIDRQDVPFSLPLFLFANDCRAIPGATTTKPSFWP